MGNSRRLARGFRLMTGCLAVAGTAVLLGSATAGAAATRGSGSVAQVRAGKPAAAPRNPFGDHPVGFWYGTDSSPISISGPQPYKEPVIGGNYGGYIGMTGKWSQWL